MEKLLHERLREYSTDDSSFGLLDGTRISALYASETKAIADEIEHYYIPRPRFEDGKPVQFGDDIEHPDTGGKCVIQSIHIFDNGNYCFALQGTARSAHYMKDEFVKRPAPKVLDADGVEIKVGDVVYKLSDGTEWRVEDIHTKEPRITVKQLNTDKDVCGGWFLANGYTHEKPVFDANGERICKGDTVWDKETGERLTVVSPCSYTKDGTFVTCKDGAPGKLWYKPEALTHREPDSFEKLRDDMNSITQPTEAAYGEFITRLTALIERDV